MTDPVVLRLSSYCGSEEDVHKGFVIALNGMGVAVVEEPAEATKAPFARVKP
jgi:hypothetical protein